MKPKKLEKRIQFIFKKKAIVSLNKDEMKKIIGGGNNYVNPSDHSGTPDCGAQTLNNTFS
jgi:hypothetical protein